MFGMSLNVTIVDYRNDILRFCKTICSNKLFSNNHIKFCKFIVEYDVQFFALFNIVFGNAGMWQGLLQAMCGNRYGRIERRKKVC